MTASCVRYPLSSEPVPGDGSSVQIAPGIFWLRMPLPVPLRWINVWALEDGEGWTIVDTGAWAPETVLSWQRAFADLMGNKPISRVIATHMHPDHCGMAGWLTEHFPARLWMSRLEYVTCRVVAADRDSVPADVIDFYHAAGWDEGAMAHYRARFGYLGRQIYPMPSGYRRLIDGEKIQIGDNEWTIVMGNGHSPEHACLNCPALKLFISGDQILPKITSNVSVYPMEPDANPLNDWMNSLGRLGQQLSSDTLVLPAHNSPFLNVHERVDELLAHHRESLSKLQEFLRNSCKVTDVFEVLFKSPITLETIHMATGEALAHLNYLKAAGRATKMLGDDGVLRWRTT